MDIKSLTEEQIAAIIAERDELKAQNDTAVSLIDEQSKKLDQLTRRPGNKPLLTVIIGKDEYEIVHGVRLDGKVYSAKELSENATVAAKLLASGSSALKKIEVEETE